MQVISIDSRCGTPASGSRVRAVCRCALVVAALQLVAASVLASAAATNSAVRHLRMGYTLQNRTGELQPLTEFYMRVPLRETPWQLCTNITATRAFELKHEEGGGQLLRFAITNLPPYAVEVIWVDVDVELSARPYPAPAPDTLLSGEGLFANGDQAFETELRRLGFHDLAKPELARRINERVGEVVSKLTYSSRNRGARYALNEGSGDCSEQMSLVVALCRQAEIPAIGLGGVATSRDRVVHATGYHDWAAYYAGNQWGIADPSRRRCGQDGSGYVAFEWIDGGPTSPDYIRRYRVTGGDVKVKME